MSKFNKNSGAYLFGFSVVMTLVLGIALAFTSESLKDKQAAQREFERKKFILSAALGTDEIASMIKEDKQQVIEVYNNRVKDFVITVDGSMIDGLSAKDVIVSKEFKLAKEERKLPIYTISKDGSDEIEYYVFPVYGNGLWDRIFGFVSVQGDLNTIQGVIFDHIGETPGLGARITEPGVQGRYHGKTIFDEGGQLVSVDMQKGENGDYSSDPHKVNGMTGATITGNGVNDMMREYLGLYENFINENKQR